MTSEHWQDAPEEHDFPAAENFLSLVMAPSDAALVVSKLRASQTQVFLAKDLLRASSLPLLKEDNKHVAHDLEKVKKGTALSPVLLVAGDVTTSRPLVVADGYHRICASYWLDENAAIPCRIARL